MNNDENNIKDKTIYNSNLDESFEIISKKYLECINYYILHSKLNTNTSNLIFLKGVSISTNIFKTILYYTKNLDLTVSTCNRGIFYYIEYINQINEKDNDFLFVQLNLKDAVIYVYRKTIFLIDDYHKKTCTHNEFENCLFNTLNIFTNFYIKIMHTIFNNINVLTLDENELDSNLLNLYHYLSSITKFKTVQKYPIKRELMKDNLENKMKLFEYLLNSTLLENNSCDKDSKNLKVIINKIRSRVETFSNEFIL